jgi:RNA polymerase sigma factor (sigma-70 family)
MAASHFKSVVQTLRRATLAGDDGGRTDGQLLERYVRSREEAAFAALVRRHGPMVWGICRRMLSHVQDAEDAFQATFLVLVRKAASVTPREMVANWLYGVARHIALKARATTARRRGREKQVTAMPEPAGEQQELWNDLQPLLDQELGRLPDKYRAVIVVCDLEGKTRKEAARHFNLPEGTVASRLATARGMLAKRLARHGLAVSGGVLAAVLSERAASARVPATVASGTIRAASLVAAGQAAAPAAVSMKAVALAEGVLKTMLLSRLKIGTAVLVVLAVLGVGTAILTPRVPAGQPAAQDQTRGEGPRAADAGKNALPAKATPGKGRVEGRFTAADTGKPVAGARVRVLIQGLSAKSAFAETTSGADGRYTLEVPLGHASLWGISTPAGYYTQDARTFGQILTTAGEPRVVRDFVLQPGSPWRVELRGATWPADKPPYFTALRDPDRQMFTSGEDLYATGDARGKTVLTIPRAGGRYRFACGLRTFPSRYEIPPANLEIDQDFDPRRVQGMPEPLPERKAVRLRDAAGRAAVVEDADVVVEAGQAVLRFRARRISTASAIVLRATAVDEAGKPVAGAKCTAAFASGNGAGMSQLEGLTDAQGKLELPDVLLPESSFGPDNRISLVVIKAGFDGAQTGELKLAEIKRAGRGDFGTVVLKPGRSLRGKVVDENGRPVHGAVVTNLTNYFLYSHLQCRTDAEGRFVMPDLSFGNQKLSAQYGDRVGDAEFALDAQSGECVVTVQLTPRNGIRSGIAPKPRPAKSVPPVSREGAWDLTPPTKEPKYCHEPRYALLVFGPKRQQRVWVVLDGTTLYVDRNGDGDLTGPGERLEPNNPTDGSNRFGNPGSHTHFDVYDFTVQAGAAGTSKFRLEHWVRAEKFTPTTDFEKKLHAKWLELHYENATLWRLEGQGQGQTPLLFMPKPADAQVCALDGPLTFVVKLPEYQVLQRGEAGCDLAFHIVGMGRPALGAEQQFFNPLATKEVPAGAHLEVEIEYPAKTANDPPLRRKYLLKQRC